MNRRAIGVCLCWVGMILAHEPSPPVLHLTDAWAIAREHNTSFQADKSTLKAQTTLPRAALGALLPQVQWQGEIQALKQRYEGDTDHINTRTSSWTLTQALWAPAAWHSLQAARHDAQAASWSHQEAKQALLMGVSQAYFDVVRAKALKHLAEAEHRLAQEERQTAQARLDAGVGVQADIEEAQATLDTSRAHVLEASLRHDVAQRAWYHTMGTTAIYDVADLTVHNLPLPRPPLEAWQDVAKAHNTSTQQAHHRTKSHRHHMALAQAGFWPSISGVLSDTTQHLRGDSRTQSAQIQAHWDVFSGGSARAQAEAARARWQASAFEKTDVTRNMRLAVHTAYTTLQTEEATALALTQAVVSREAALKATEAGRDAGTRTQADVLAQIAKLYAQKRLLLTSQLNRLVHWLQLQKAAGQISEHHLAHLDKAFSPP